MFRFVLPAMGSLLLLSACGGGGSDGRLPTDLLNDRVLSGAALATRVDDLGGTAFKEMPTTGAGNFRGVAELTVDRTSKIHPDGLNMIGDATMTADFGAGRVTGTVDNFQGVEVGKNKPVVAYAVDGKVAVGGKASEIGAAGPNRFTTDYAGTLAIKGTGDVDVAGRLDGQFVGTRATAVGTPRVVKGLTAVDGDLVATQGTRRNTGSLAIYAEQK